MAIIKNFLNNIKTARKGADVRDSIHDAIDAINKENIERLDGQDGRLNNQDNKIKENINKQDLLEQKYEEQIKNIAASEPQSPEIVDARAGFNTLGSIIKQKIYHFENVQAMKNCLSLVPGDVCQTLGYYEENDGGNATYKIVNENALEDDGGSVINLVNGCKSVLVHDEKVNILQFGAIPETDSSTQIQKCIDYVSSLNGIMEFPDNKLFYAFNLNLSTKALTIDGNNSILKKPNLSISPYNYTVAQMKSVRILKNNISTKLDTSTDLFTIKNLNFDGNALSMWQPSDGYSQEQASLLLISAENKTNNKQALVRINIENCRFLDNVSDGIHIRSNVKANIKNCYSKNCFRGGLTLTGGNSFIDVDSFTFRTDVEGMPDGIDVEIDGEGMGDTTENNYSIVLNMNNIDIDYDLDIAGCGALGKITINNIILNKGRFIVTAEKNSGPIVFNNGHFKETREKGNFDIRTLYQNNLITFNNCIFEGFEVTNDDETITSNNKIGLLAIYDEIENIKGDEYITFNNCTFKKINGFYGGLNKLQQIEFNSCIFERNIYGDAIGQYNGQTAFAPKILKIKNCTFMNKSRWLMCKSVYSPVTKIYLSDNKILEPENAGILVHNPIVYFDEIYEYGYKIAVSNGGAPKFRGYRTIISDELIQQDASQNIRFINEVDKLQLSDLSNSYRRHNNTWISEN